MNGLYKLTTVPNEYKGRTLQSIAAVLNNIMYKYDFLHERLSVDIIINKERHK